MLLVTKLTASWIMQPGKTVYWLAVCAQQSNAVSSRDIRHTSLIAKRTQPALHSLPARVGYVHLSISVIHNPFCQGALDPIRI